MNDYQILHNAPEGATHFDGIGVRVMKEIKVTIEYNGGKAIHTFPAKGDKAIMQQVIDYFEDFKRQCKKVESSDQVQSRIENMQEELDSRLIQISQQQALINELESKVEWLQSVINNGMLPKGA